MQAIHRYKIAIYVPSNGAISFERLSAECNLNLSDLKRLLRLIMTRSIFCEPQVGYVAHTTASRLLKNDPQARDFSGIICDERFPASAQVGYRPRFMPHNDNAYLTYTTDSERFANFRTI
jgi:hypothetical protein